MKLEEQVCSLELSKRLKTLGVSQESAFYWYPVPKAPTLYLKREFDKYKDIWSIHQKNPVGVLVDYFDNFDTAQFVEHERVAAFSVAELIEKVESSANEWALGYNDSGCFYHFRKGERGTGNMIDICEQKESRFDSESTPFVNAFAEWVIHLIEKGLIKP